MQVAMCSSVLKMKFSYRVAVASLVIASAVVLYFTWDNDLMPWSRWHSQSLKLTTRESRSDAITMPLDTPHDTCTSRLHRNFNRSIIRTYDILHDINSHMENGVLKGTFKKEGEPIPDNKIDKTYKSGPLKVILIPHSHSDPGWHKTVIGYFNDQTKPTLDNMVYKMIKYPNMTFIWAESVFLHIWWEESSPDMQKSVQQLIQRGQLEVVVGSWVVPDEANPHYYALIDQMIEGHQWLEYNLKVKPSHTWSLDPFGYSSTHPYLYQRAGYESMVILRVHERVKSALEDKMGLEFFWRQNWDNSHGDDTEIFTQLMPYKLYNIKHTCGPDQAICLKFDFRKIPGEMSEARSEPITDDNVHKLSTLLVEEYHKKASLFKHNVLLVPLGDDFRYDRPIEWDQQYTNYQKLFNYINANKGEFNVEARFGTLQDYFSEVKAVSTQVKSAPKSIFPTLEGDFFPYTDEHDEYWAGYFTSRPYFKMLGRELEVQLRAAETLHSLASAAHRDGYKEFTGNMQLLELARRSLGAYQHHDAITGTSTRYVNIDYEDHLLKGLDHAHAVIKTAMTHLLEETPPKDTDTDFTILDVENVLGKKMLSPNLKKFNIPSGGLRLAVFNPVAQRRRDIVKVSVADPYVMVTDGKGQLLPCQVSPIWVDALRFSTTEHELSWTVDLPPLGIQVFILLAGDAKTEKKCPLASYSLSKSAAANEEPRYFKSQQMLTHPMMENDQLSLTFSTLTGFLQSVTKKPEGKTVNASVSFQFYTSSRSGAYIFKPEGAASARELTQKPLYRYVDGPLYSEMQVVQRVVNHTVRLLKQPNTMSEAIQIDNIVDMTTKDQRELIMRIDTNIQNTDNVFFTDLNGFQVMKRKTFTNFPIEANYYPSTTFVYLEDQSWRVSLLSTQSLGASSQKPGSLEVMLDRRLRYDDGRGLGEGVQDNKRTPSRFYLLLEALGRDGHGRAEQDMNAARLQTSSYPSLRAHRLADWLRHYPITASLGSGKAHTVYEPLRSPLPCDITFVNLRSLKSPLRAQGSVEAALILQNVGYECDIQVDDKICDGRSPGDGIVFSDWLSPEVKVVSMKESTLSLMHDKRKVDMTRKEYLKSMHLYAYRLLLG